MAIVIIGQYRTQTGTMAHCRRRARVFVDDESLPKNASGKILRRDLRTSLSSLDDDPSG